MMVIYITGGIGAGKSFISSYITKNYKVHFISADSLAKELMKPNGSCYEELYDAFNEYAVFGDDGNIISEVLSDIVFNDETLLKKLNDIVHPKVFEEIENYINKLNEREPKGYLLVEAALLPGDEYRDLFDNYIYVHVEESLRIKRLMDFRCYSYEKCLEFIKRQSKEEIYRSFCDFEIDNNHDTMATKKSVDIIMEQLRVKKMDREYVFGLDIGTRNVVGTVGYMDDEIFRVLAQSTMEHKSRSMLDGQIHDIEKVSKVVAAVKEDLEKKLDFELKNVCIAAAGRVLQTVTTHVEYDYPEETVVSGEDLYTLDLLGVDKAHHELTHDDDRYKFYCVGYTVKKYYLNEEEFTSLEGHKATKIAEDIIVTFLPEDVVDGLYSAVERAGLTVANLTLEPIAAINVAIPQSFRMLNISLVDVGAGTSDICITDEGSIIAYGMIPYAGDELTEVLVKEYLVDFANAENMKKAAAAGEKVTYTDIMGLEHTITSEEVWKVAEPVLEKITTAICDKIIELNYGKAVAAVFVVGGGGKAHGFCEKISEKLEILKERVALRGEDVMKMVEFEEEEIKKDPLLVTPIGICLNYFEQRNTFIMIRFNGELMKLYDNGNLKVVDAALQAGLSTDEIFPKRGNEIHFTVDGVSRMVRGTKGESARVFMNGREVGLNDTLLPNCEITIESSTEGEHASIRIEDLEEFKDNYVDFVVNDAKVRAPKFVEVNGTLATGDYEIKDGDAIETRSFYTVGQLAEFMDVVINPNHEILVNNRSSSVDTIIYENFNIDWTIDTKAMSKPLSEEEKERIRLEEEALEAEEEELTEEDEEERRLAAQKAAREKALAAEIKAQQINNILKSLNDKDDEPEPEDDGVDRIKEINSILRNLESPEDAIPHDISLTVNGEKINLRGKKEYIFVDIYNEYKFDPEEGRGKRIVTTRNGKPISFADAIYDGDDITLDWEERWQQK